MPARLGLLALAAELAFAQAVTYTYDSAGHLISANYGSAGSIGYTCDKAGHLISRTQYTACDIKQTGSVTVADVQLIINEALGVAPAVYNLSGNSAVNVVDVQIEINAALGLGCAAK